MAGIEKTAGKFTVDSWTDGWPQWCNIKVRDRPGDDPINQMNGLTIDDLKDLRYCLDEVIGKLERGERA